MYDWKDYKELLENLMDEDIFTKEEILQTNPEDWEKWEDDLDLLSYATEYWDLRELLEEMNPIDFLWYPHILNDYDLGEYNIDEFYSHRLDNELLGRYFDYEAFGRDIRLESNGDYTSGGWIEYIG